MWRRWGFTAALWGGSRIAFIGQRRDDLQKNNEAHTPLAVAESFATIKWGRGRAVNESIVEKSLRIYTRLNDTPGAVECIMKAQALWGRGSPWEEWTKLAATIQPCKSHSQIVWVLQTVFYDKLNKVRPGDYSRDELTRKANSIGVFLLRHKFITGALQELVGPAAEHLVVEGVLCTRRRWNSSRSLARLINSGLAQALPRRVQPTSPPCFPRVCRWISGCSCGIATQGGATRSLPSC